MKVRNILDQKGTNYLSVEPGQPITDAVDAMIQHRIGSLLVMEGERLLSIVTERDIVWAAGKMGPRLTEVKIRDIMAKMLITVSIDDSVDHAMDLMTSNPTRQRIRHLPVMDGDKLAGIISIGDIVHALLTETKFENNLLKNYIKNWPAEEAR
jgi:CBS domain-containing protein